MNPAKVHSVFYEPPPTEGVQGVHHAQPPTPRCEKIDSPTLGFDSSEIDLTGFWRDKFARFQARRLIPSHSALNWTGILLFTAISTWGVAMTLPKVIGDTSPSSAISNQLVILCVAAAIIASVCYYLRNLLGRVIARSPFTVAVLFGAYGLWHNGILEQVWCAVIAAIAIIWGLWPIILPIAGLLKPAPGSLRVASSISSGLSNLSGSK